MTTIPVQRTARLTLRAIRAEYHCDLFALARDTEVMRYMHEGPPPTASDVWNRMAGALGQWAIGANFASVSRTTSSLYGE